MILESKGRVFTVENLVLETSNLNDDTIAVYNSKTFSKLQPRQVMLGFCFIGKLGVSFVCDNTDGLHLYFCIFSIYMNLKEPQCNAKPKSSNAEPEPDNTKATRVGKSNIE